MGFGAASDSQGHAWESAPCTGIRTLEDSGLGSTPAPGAGELGPRLPGWSKTSNCLYLLLQERSDLHSRLPMVSAAVSSLPAGRDPDHGHPPQPLRASAGRWREEVLSKSRRDFLRGCVVGEYPTERAREGLCRAGAAPARRAGATSSRLRRWSRCAPALGPGGAPRDSERRAGLPVTRRRTNGCGASAGLIYMPARRSQWACEPPAAPRCPPPRPRCRGGRGSFGEWPRPRRAAPRLLARPASSRRRGSAVTPGGDRPPSSSSTISPWTADRPARPPRNSRPPARAKGRRQRRPNRPEPPRACCPRRPPASRRPPCCCPASPPSPSPAEPRGRRTPPAGASSCRSCCWAARSARRPRRRPPCRGCWCPPNREPRGC